MRILMEKWIFFVKFKHSNSSVLILELVRKLDIPTKTRYSNCSKCIISESGRRYFTAKFGNIKRFLGTYLVNGGLDAKCQIRGKYPEGVEIQYDWRLHRWVDKEA